MMNSHGNNNNDTVAIAADSSSLLLSSSGRDISTMHRIPPWTIADLFHNPPALAVLYHSIGTSYDLSTPLGAVVGGMAQLLLFGSSRPYWQVVANGSLIFGFTGMGLGAAYCAFVASKGDRATPLPWNKAGLLDRQQRLASNKLIRLLDAGTYSGLAVGGLSVVVAGGSLGLSSGFLGVLQAMSLGASCGSLLTLGYYNVFVS